MLLRTRYLLAMIAAVSMPSNLKKGGSKCPVFKSEYRLRIRGFRY